jgi:hypothetical protein
VAGSSKATCKLKKQLVCLPWMLQEEVPEGCEHWTGKNKVSYKKIKSPGWPRGENGCFLQVYVPGTW